MPRVRIRFSKLGKIRWTSHRDVVRMWERAFRRERLPLRYTSGFSPRPRISFGLALPTGHESVAEYLDVELDERGDLDLSGWPERLSAALPRGVDALAAVEIATATPSLQEDVTSSTWRLAAVPVEGAPALRSDALAERAASVMTAKEVVVTRVRKGVEVTDDIRDSILELRLLGPVGLDDGDGMWLEAELAARPRSIRPSELLAALGGDVEERHVRRLLQWITRDGARREPLEVALPVATSAPHALERAS